MMLLWRISNHADLKGIGGLRAAGRWHYAGQPVVYLAEHPALALLETLVHLEIRSIDQLPDGYQLLRVDVSDAMTVAEIAEDDAPTDWRVNPSWTRGAGTEWLGTQPSALLRVPSAIVPFAHNYLLNPVHSDAADVRIVEVVQAPHDSRILRLLAGG
ncbi:RES family NAD+ phosphorylase [Burkholderia oklahomensis]|nr:RES family NAD+ phosphorylase [Burkholderia oklahomensis]MBI0361524.1 RES family NAD+ phosphorylase [Burkholderia oklahomensis]QPS39270.1 RES family NAD+ phosphorylase [Burkholderia oklahomensis]